MRHSAALIVFAKYPVPGKVKTRLIPALGAEGAAQLYTAFLHDAIQQYRTLDVDIRLYLDPPARSLHQAIDLDGITVHHQQGAGLGARMLHAFLESFAVGYESLVIIGTDHPTLPSAFVEQAFVLLRERRQISIGPSEDGGYYLLGMNDFYPLLFEDMTYSHADVFMDTLERAAECQAQVNILPTWYDVDTPAELARLRTDLGANPDQAPTTVTTLASLGHSVASNA